jgi:hypothetical protein
MTVPSLKSVFKLELCLHSDVNSNDGGDEPVCIFAFISEHNLCANAAAKAPSQADEDADLALISAGSKVLNNNHASQ